MPLRVAFVTSHPIQYQVPVFRHLARRDDLDFQVLFAMLPDAATQGAGFGVEFEWDIPLLEGYEYSVLKNVSKNPGVTHFGGCDTPGLLDELRQRKIDVVVVNGWVVKTCVQALTACRRLKIPCIVRGEANNLRKRPWWKCLLQRQLVRRYDAVLPIGTANRDFYRSHGVSESQMFDARYCIENSRFAKAAVVARPQRKPLRAAWNIPENAVCCLYCGKFEAKKHPVELVTAFLQVCQTLQQASPEAPSIHLLMVGDGQLRQQCEQLATKHAHGSAVTFAGFLNQSQIVDAYVASDVLVLPSDAGETWGLVVNEAMACGLPAIVSDQVGCASDLIVANETGWVFTFGDWQALSDRLVALAAESIDWQHMQDACQKKISQYSPSAAADGMLAAVNSVCR
ncbi:MAG: glycosyltransferase family 4 protein [Planctomycetaceae bacterium]